MVSVQWRGARQVTLCFLNSSSTGTACKWFVTILGNGNTESFSFAVNLVTGNTASIGFAIHIDVATLISSRIVNGNNFLGIAAVIVTVAVSDISIGDMAILGNIGYWRYHSDIADIFYTPTPIFFMNLPFDFY